MVQFIKNNKAHIKIFYWGIAGSGKTTIADTLSRLIKENKLDFEPTNNLTKISMKSGNITFHVYTVAGQRRFSPLGKKIYGGKIGIIFVVDSQTHLLEDNIESLKELKTISRGDLIRKIPLIVMLNKQDLNDVIGVEDFKHVLKRENLWHEPDHELYHQNPVIYRTCALYDKRKNIYRSFYECVRRILNGREEPPEGGDFPFPYLFKPPSPPGDLGLAGQVQVEKVPSEEEPEFELFCKYCGSKLIKKQKFCRFCGKKVE